MMMENDKDHDEKKVAEHTTHTAGNNTINVVDVTGIKRKPGEEWKKTEIHEIPHNNLLLVFPG
ncbi:hypothetical protein FRC18_006181 [Serendipita sp. 400]|nr:hypothetical protein FRC18_006181 [Serendipita sp. 400]